MKHSTDSEPGIKIPLFVSLFMIPDVGAPMVGDPHREEKEARAADRFYCDESKSPMKGNAALDDAELSRATLLGVRKGSRGSYGSPDSKSGARRRAHDRLEQMFTIS